MAQLTNQIESFKSVFAFDLKSFSGVIDMSKLIVIGNNNPITNGMIKGILFISHITGNCGQCWEIVFKAEVIKKLRQCLKHVSKWSGHDICWMLTCKYNSYVGIDKKICHKTKAEKNIAYLKIYLKCISVYYVCVS